MTSYPTPAFAYPAPLPPPSNARLRHPAAHPASSMRTLHPASPTRPQNREPCAYPTPRLAYPRLPAVPYTLTAYPAPLHRDSRDPYASSYPAPALRTLHPSRHPDARHPYNSYPAPIRVPYIKPCLLTPIRRTLHLTTLVPSTMAPYPAPALRTLHPVSNPKLAYPLAPTPPYPASPLTPYPPPAPRTLHPGRRRL